MLAHAGQAILHGCLAAAFIEGVLRVWHVREPAARMRLRLVALVAPLVSTTIIPLGLPVRATREFLVTCSVFSGVSWDAFSLGPVGLSTLATVVLGGLGVALFLRDTLPFLLDTVRASADDGPVAPDARSADMLARALDGLSPDGRPVASVDLLATDAPVLFCSGVEHPHVTVSTGTLALLSDEELRAAVAHELVHLRRRDPALGWLLMALRTLQAFNPAAQVVGRQLVDDIERRADWEVAAHGMGAPLARAVAKLAYREHVRSDLSPGWRQMAFVRGFAARAAEEATAARCERILTSDAPEWTPGPAYALLAACALAVLLVFVV